MSFNWSTVQLPDSESVKLKTRQVLVDPWPVRRDELLYGPNVHILMRLDEAGN